MSMLRRYFSSGKRSEWDAVVVGAGVMGSSCAMYLAESGLKRVLLLEQYKFGHGNGSSHGKSRITRRTYPQLHYTMAMQLAFQLWGDIEKKARRTLFTETGGLDLGHIDNPDFQSLKRHAIELGVGKSLSMAEVQQLWPVLPARCDTEYFYSPHSGILHADVAVAAMQGLAKAAGAVLREGVQAQHIEDAASAKAVIHTADGEEIVTDNIVLCPGAWSSKLLKQWCNMNIAAVPHHVVVGYWKCSDAYAVSSKFPVLIHYDAPCFYAIPSFEYPGLIKVCLHGGHEFDVDERVDADKIDAQMQQNVGSVADFIRQNMPGVDASAPVKTIQCKYTMTPDSDFVIDQVPNRSGKAPMWISAGFSGHGFKLAPVVGKMIADMVSQKQSSIEASPFSIQRQGIII